MKKSRIEALLFMLILDIVARKGLNNVTVDSLVEEITPKGRGMGVYLSLLDTVLMSFIPSCVALVPDYIKKELLQQIRDYIEKTS